MGPNGHLDTCTSRKRDVWVEILFKMEGLRIEAV